MMLVLVSPCLSDGSSPSHRAISVSTATFGPGEPGQTLLTTAGERDIFVARYAGTAEPPPIASGVEAFELYK